MTRELPPSSRITALREHPRTAGRYAVELDGEAAGAVSLEAVAELGLRVGVVLDAAARGRLEAAARSTACYDKALGALARRSRSRADLGRWLAAREFARAEIVPTLDKLETLGLLNDLEFARSFARTRLSGRGFGPRRVAAELARHGVARSIVDDVLAAAREDDGLDEPAAIAAIIARRRRALAGLEPAVARRRLVGYLTRRGFSGEAVLAALRETPTP